MNMNMRLNVSSAKWRPFFLGPNCVNPLASERCGSDFVGVDFKLIPQSEILGTSCEIGRKWVSQSQIDDTSTLAKVMAWCRQATSHYMSQFGPDSVTRPQRVNLLFFNCLNMWHRNIDALCHWYSEQHDHRNSDCFAQWIGVSEKDHVILWWQESTQVWFDKHHLSPRLGQLSSGWGLTICVHAFIDWCYLIGLWEMWRL